MAAAAIIPIIAPELISAAIPLVKPVIQSLVLHVEKLFGTKTGPDKFKNVLQAVTPIVESLATSGRIPGTIDGVAIGSLIESVVQEFKALGVLTPTVNPPTVPTPATPGAVVGSSSIKVFGTLTLG